MEKQLISKDRQIKKFCFYGFFKNLKFFEPYLLIYLLGFGLTLFDIGLLFALREGIMYVLEVPSGIVADFYGKKKALLMCFVFYMISFVFLFFGEQKINLWLGMTFYGLGEAFRSGTHKAMILSYLDHKGWYEEKGYVYGLTRSYSLIGSSLSAFLSIILVLKLPALKWIFLVALLPYVIDFALVASYPAYIDEKHVSEFNFKSFIQLSFTQIKTIFKNVFLLKLVLSAASYDAIFKTIKDYIQPILSTLILAAGVGAIGTLTEKEMLKIYLGVVYGVFYIFSSGASKNIYRLTDKVAPMRVFNRLFDIMGVVILLLAFAIHQSYFYMAVFFFFLLYLMMDARRPVFVNVSGDHMAKDQRATVLSIESQFKAIFMVLLAPLFGWVATQYSIELLFMVIGILILVFNRLVK